MILLIGNRHGKVRLGAEGASERSSLFASSAGAPVARQKLRVMIVDDEIFVAMHLECVLEDMGYEVSGIVSRGENAVQEFALQRPDIVLMDINLGTGIDGIATAERLRETGNARIVFVTAYSDEATRARAQAAAPGSPVVAKPVTPSALEAALKTQAPRRH